jgi:enamine deaminase RidA (YjgF/YER057c/UK114 family)
MESAGSERAHREVFVPAVWAEFYEQTHIPAALRVGDTLRLTGHTGETPDGAFSPDAETQMRQTFLNIAVTLADAGATWSDVVEINSYRVGLQRHAELLLTVAAEFLQDPYPVWTDVGVTELFLPEAIVEIRCIAVLPPDRVTPATPAPRGA